MSAILAIDAGTTGTTALVIHQDGSVIGRGIYQGFQNQVPTVIVLAGLYILINLALTVLATWVQRKFVGENDPIALETDDSGRAA